MNKEMKKILIYNLSLKWKTSAGWDGNSIFLNILYVTKIVKYLFKIAVICS